MPGPEPAGEARPDPRSAPRSRPFTLGDSIILVASTAVAFALIRQESIEWSTFLTFYGANLGPRSNMLSIASPLLMTGSFSLLILRLKRPHPRRRQIARQPGVIACGAASFMATVCMVQVAAQMLRDRFLSMHPSPLFVAMLPLQLSAHVGPGVAGAWGALAFGGRWGRASGWIDLVGRGLGFGWLALWLLSIYFTYFL